MAGESSSVEERLNRIENLLSKLLNKIESLEEIISMFSSDERGRVALELAIAFSLPAQKAVKIASSVIKLIKELGTYDPISMAIIEALSASEKSLTISELTKRVRVIRGTASRRIITERVKAMAKVGVVEVRRSGRRVLVRLRRISKC